MAEVLPSYSEIIQEIGRQLQSRKKLLFFRFLQLLWPVFILPIFVIIIVFGLFYFRESQFLERYSGFVLPAIPLFFSFWAFFALFYYGVVNWIFGIEKKIWIISYFDKKNLTQKQSWQIAKRLAIPSLKFMIKVFVRFYFLPFIIFFLALLGIGYLFSPLSGINFPSLYLPPIFLRLFGLDILELPLFLFMLTFILIVISFFVYCFFTMLKLRFVWFLFLDFYKKGKTFDEILHMNKVLLKIEKEESFKKALTMYLGAYTVEGIAYAVFQQLGKLVRLGKFVEAVGGEITRQISDFATIIAIFLLYNYTRHFANNPRQINELIYELK
jgi:hypothetical protein